MGINTLEIDKVPREYAYNLEGHFVASLFPDLSLIPETEKELIILLANPPQSPIAQWIYSTPEGINSSEVFPQESQWYS